MTTLHEEQAPLPRKHSLDLIRDEEIEDEENESRETGSKLVSSNHLPAAVFGPTRVL